VKERRRQKKVTLDKERSVGPPKSPRSLSPERRGAPQTREEPEPLLVASQWATSFAGH
jgi:hypothetical protein